MVRTITQSAALALLVCTTGALAVPPYPQWPLPPSAPVMDMGRRGVNPPGEFGLYFSVWANQNQWWGIDVSAIPFRMDIVNISAGAAPSYPMQGPHMIEMFPGGREAFYTQFLNELRNIVTSWIPDAEYDGLIILDYEWFDAAYTGHINVPSVEGRTARDGDFIDDWRETLRETRAAALSVLTPAQQEEYFRQEWISTVREFYERTFNAVKQLRPRTKVGFYNHPLQEYWRWRDPAQAALMRQGNTEEAGWFYQMVDVICPSIYSMYYSVPDAQAPAPNQDRERDFDEYIRANLTEALRVANGKPVYPYVDFQYHPGNPGYRWQIVNDYNMRRPLELAREMGCNGVVIWGWFQSQQQFDDARTFWQTRYAPFLRQFSLLPAVAPANPVFPSGGGGTNAGASGTGTGSGTGAGSGTGTGTGTGTGGGTGTGTGSTDTGGATGNSGTTGGGGGGAGLGSGSSSGAAGGTSGGTTGGSGVGTVGGGGGSSTGSGVVSVGGSGGGATDLPTGGTAAPAGSADAGSGGSIGGSSNGSSAPARAGGSSGGGSSGASTGAGSGGTALSAGGSGGSSPTGAVTTYHNGGSGGGVTTQGLAGASMMMAAGPVNLGEGATAVLPAVDLAGAEFHQAPADQAALGQALARAAGPVGDGAQPANALDGARVVRPGTDESFMVAAAPTTPGTPDNPPRIVRPGLDGAWLAQSSPLEGAVRPGPAGMRIVRPPGATGSRLLSTQQLTQGGRIVRPGQGADTRTPATPPARQTQPLMVITGVPTQP